MKQLSSMQPDSVLDFWFDELAHEERFGGGEAMDERIREHFATTHHAAAANELWRWRETAAGSLAELIVLDQFSRHIYRGQAEAFFSDAQALALAQRMVEKQFDTALPTDRRIFVYMPFMHSESKAIHEGAVELFANLGNQEALKYEQIHKDIIDRFGRYPHRNQQLGRESTAAETTYLEQEQEDFFAS